MGNSASNSSQRSQSRPSQNSEDIHLTSVLTHSGSDINVTEGSPTDGRASTPIEIHTYEVEKLERLSTLANLKDFVRETTSGCGGDVAECTCSTCVVALESFISSIQIHNFRTQCSILHYTAWVQDENGLDLIDYLILNGKQSVEGKDGKGSTPLNYAAESRNKINLAVIAHLIKRHHAKVDVEDKEGYTPLLLACMNRSLDDALQTDDTDVVKTLHLLSERGKLLKNLNEQEKLNEVPKTSPFSIAVQFTLSRVTESLIHIAETAGCIETLIRHKDTDGSTTLHYLVIGTQYSTCDGFAKVFDLVHPIAAKFGVADVEDIKGRTPLFLACSRGADVSIIRKFLDGGATLAKNIDQDCCLTAFHFAALSADRRIIDLLIEQSREFPETYLRKHATLSEFTKKFETPLCIAARKGNAETANAILQAAHEHDKRLAEDLFQHLACIDLADDEDEGAMPPLAVAIQQGNKDAVRVLITWAYLDCLFCRALELGLKEAVSTANDLSLKLTVSAIHDIYHNGNRMFGAGWLYESFELAVASSWRLAVSTFHSKLPELTSDAMKLIYLDENGLTDTIFRNVIIRMPLEALSFLDDWTTCTGDVSRDSEKYELNFDYRFIEDSYSKEVETVDEIWDDDGHKLQEGAELELTCANDRFALQSNHPLWLMAKSDPTGELLSHPLTLSLLQHKWKAFGIGFFYAGLMLYASFVLLFSFYIANIEVKTHYKNGTKESYLIYCAHVLVLYSDWLTYVYFGCWLLMAINILKETGQLLVRGPLSYAKDYTNWIEVIVYTGAALMLVTHRTGCRDQGAIWQVGICVVMLAWFNLLLVLRKVSVHAVMFFQILQTFVKVSLLLLVCLPCFTLVFHMLMPTHSGFTGWDLLKTLTLAIGEIEYTDTFYNETLHYPIASYIVLGIFICGVTIVLMNLLVGLAVGDVNSVSHHARIMKIKMIAMLILEIEMLLPKSLRRRKIIGSQKLRSPRRQTLKDPLLVPDELSDLSIKNAYLDRTESMKQSATSDPSACNIEEALKNQIKNLQETQEKLQEGLSSISGKMDDISSQLNEAARKK